MMMDEIKISVVENGTVLTDTHGICPKCSYNFDGDDVCDYFKYAYAERHPEKTTSEITQMAQETAAMYGWSPEKPVRFSRIIGIEIPGGYDGIMFHQCPECETTWDRFNGKEVVISQNFNAPNEELLNGTDPKEDTRG